MFRVLSLFAFVGEHWRTMPGETRLLHATAIFLL